MFQQWWHPVRSRGLTGLRAHHLRGRRCGVVAGKELPSGHRKELLGNLKTPFKVSISKHNHPMCSPIFWTSSSPSSLIIINNSHISVLQQSSNQPTDFKHLATATIHPTQRLNDHCPTQRPDDSPLQWCTSKWSTARPVATPSTSGPTKQISLMHIEWSLGEQNM